MTLLWESVRSLQSLACSSASLLVTSRSLLIGCLIVYYLLFIISLSGILCLLFLSTIRSIIRCLVFFVYCRLLMFFSAYCSLSIFPVYDSLYCSVYCSLSIVLFLLIAVTMLFSALYLLSIIRCYN